MMAASNNETPDGKRTWICRFHPFHWFHEVGCPHVQWTAEQLADAERHREEFQKLRLSGQILPLELLERLKTMPEGVK